MLQQSVFPDSIFSLPTIEACSPKDVACRSSTRFLWTGLGFAVLMLVLGSACALHPVASRDSAESSVLAFSRMPALGLTGFIAATHPDTTSPAGLSRLLGQPVSVAAKKPNLFPRSSTAMNAGIAVLERQRAPPAPPPAPPSPRGGGGPGGPDDGWPQVRRLSKREALALLTNWIARSRVYVMNAQFGDVSGAKVHRQSLADLEMLRSDSTTWEGTAMGHGITEYGLFRALVTEHDQRFLKGRGLPLHQPRFLVALESSDQKTVLAVAGGYTRWMHKNRASLVVDYVSLSPLELDKEASTAGLRIQQGLHHLVTSTNQLLRLEGLGLDLFIKAEPPPARRTRPATREDLHGE